MQNKQYGFSIIEILVVLLLISLLGSLLIPTFMYKQTRVVKKQFIAQFTTLIQDTVYQAINLEKIHQIYFDFDHHEIITKIHDSTIEDSNKHKQFGPSIIDTIVPIPEQFTIKNFFIGKDDEKESKNIIRDAWFYIMPDGTSQPIIINIENQHSDSIESDNFSLSINPFYSQVHEHESFQYP